MKKILFVVVAVLTFAACGHKVNRADLLSDIEQKEASLDYSSCDIDAIDSVKNEMVVLYRQFYTTFPTDSLAPGYMQRVADMLISLERTDEAVAVLDSIIKQYPEYQDMGGCWFLKGYAYEEAEQFPQAREAYTYFIDNYPDHYLAESTRSAIQYIGMTPEEMFDAIMNSASDKGLSAL